MSEFQLYQFKSIDRPLTEAECKEIGSWSSRTHPTTTSATFTYSYGDFPKDEEKVVEEYFDAMLYAANWGTRRLMFRLPKNLIDKELLTAYTFETNFSGDYIALRECKSCYLLDIYFSNEEGGGWLGEDEYDLNALIPLRKQILNEDYRALYLVWLQFAANAAPYREEEEDELPELPPVPAKLPKLTGALKAMIGFFEIEADNLAKGEKHTR